MFEHPLYQEIRAQIEPFLPVDFGEALRNMLVWMVLGVLDSTSASPRQIAQALQRLGMSGAQASSLERRVRRFMNTDGVQALTCLHPLARYHLCLGRPRELILIIDPTTQTDQFVLVTVGVWYRGRSLPLAWTIWAGNVPLKGDRFWERVDQLLAEVAQVLPLGIPIIWLADRAFGTPQFTDLVVARGWHFVVRVQSQTRYQDQHGRGGPIRSLVKRVNQRRKLSGWAFKKRGWRQVSIVVYHGRGHTTPLCLVSSLPPAWSLIRLYRQRYAIEALFRDYKGHGWHWEQSQVRDLDHLQPLLTILALATWLTLMVGTMVADECLAQARHHHHRRTRPEAAKSSLFQLGLIRLQAWLHRSTHCPLAWRLTDWQAPNWSTQIMQAFRRTWVFA